MLWLPLHVGLPRYVFLNICFHVQKLSTVIANSFQTSPTHIRPIPKSNHPPTPTRMAQTMRAVGSVPSLPSYASYTIQISIGF